MPICPQKAGKKTKTKAKPNLYFTVICECQRQVESSCLLMWL